ncbi:MAG: threonine synthase [Pleomorphochaeta sp.]
MDFVSTRRLSKKVTAGEAILKGLADDGGLYVPEKFPSLVKMNVSGISSYPEMAFEVLAPYFEDDKLIKINDLAEICMDSFNFNVPLIQLGDKLSVLELFHGPTAAFKDFGARFLASSLEKIIKKTQKELTILVATSGDTGGAVASAFYKKEGIKVKVLFPKDRVSDRQKKQLTVLGENIEAYEVDGSFDDCQKMVKDAFMDKELSEKYGLTSANSINLGRLLPQSVYYVYASHLFRTMYGVNPNIIIPSGNVGNSCAAYWAFSTGVPIESIVLAVNANKTIPDYLESGVYTPRASVKTLANAMDVGSPSNMERLLDLYGDVDIFRQFVRSYSVSDKEIEQTIKSTYDETSYIMCPHTACAKKVYETHYKNQPSILVSTAHPAKFETIVEPLINKEIPIPTNLKDLLSKEEKYKSVSTNYKDLFL